MNDFFFNTYNNKFQVNKTLNIDHNKKKLKIIKSKLEISAQY